METAVTELGSLLGEGISEGLGLPQRLLALKLIEEDEELEGRIRRERPELIPKIQRLRQELSQRHGRPADVVLSSERHSLIFALVSFYLGPNLAFYLYILNLIFIAVAGNLLSRLQPEVVPEIGFDKRY